MKNMVCIITLTLLPLAVPADDATKVDVIEKQGASTKKSRMIPCNVKEFG